MWNLLSTTKYRDSRGQIDGDAASVLEPLLDTDPEAGVLPVHSFPFDSGKTWTVAESTSGHSALAGRI